jgi:hypothetical protein
MASHQRIRFTVLINDYFLVIALALAIIAAGGAWMTYTTAVNPGTHAEQRVVSSWHVDGTFNYSATVVEDSPIFDRGDVRANRRFYITNATPKLDGTFRFQFGGTTGNATVTTQVILVNYAETKKENIRIWEVSTPLKKSQKHITSKNTSTTNFTVDADTIRDLKRRLVNRHGSLYRVSDMSSSVNVTTRINGTISGNRVQRVFTYSLPINGTKDYYVVEQPKKPQQEITVTQRVIVPDDPSMLSIVAAIASLVVPLAALIALVYGRQTDRFAVPQKARVDARSAKLRSEFDEWVTQGTVAAANDRTTVSVGSLEGLVDVAIDSGQRAIKDEETGVYVVLDTDTRYQFTPEWTVNGNGDHESLVTKNGTGTARDEENKKIEESIRKGKLTENEETTTEKEIEQKEEIEGGEDTPGTETTEVESEEAINVETEQTEEKNRGKKAAKYKERTGESLQRFTDALIARLPPRIRVRMIGAFRDDRVTTLRKSGVPADDLITYVEEGYDIQRIDNLLKRGISPDNLKEYLGETNDPELEEADESNQEETDQNDPDQEEMDGSEQTETDGSESGKSDESDREETDEPEQKREQRHP